MPFAAIYQLQQVWSEGALKCFCHGGRESMLLCPSAGCANPPESMLFHYAGTQPHLSGTANSWHLTYANTKATWLSLWINGLPPSLPSTYFCVVLTFELLSKNMPLFSSCHPRFFLSKSDTDRSIDQRLSGDEVNTDERILQIVWFYMYIHNHTTPTQHTHTHTKLQTNINKH